MLSVDAPHDTVIEVVVAVVRESEPGAVGGIVSPPATHAFVAAEIVV